MAQGCRGQRPARAPRLPAPNPSAQTPSLQASDQSWPSLVFCIGGPFGHAPAVRQRGDDTIRLSKMVLNHQVGAGSAPGSIGDPNIGPRLAQLATCTA